MKQVIFFASMLFVLSANAGVRALTDTGDVVILNKDGTWHYPVEVKPPALEPKGNKIVNKIAKANFSFKSKKTDAEFFIDPKVWTPTEPMEPDHEYVFINHDKDLYAMAITEGIELGFELLLEAAVINMKAVASDVVMLKNEYHIVNGTKVMYVVMEASISGASFRFIGYQHSGKAGSTQYYVYSSTSLMDRYMGDAEQLLSGFVINN